VLVAFAGSACARTTHAGTAAASTHAAVPGVSRTFPADPAGLLAQASRAGPWLGLNGNSTSNKSTHEWLGPVDLFSRNGIVYDRSFDLTAGETPSETVPDRHGGTYFEDALSYDAEAGMVPVVTVEFNGYNGEPSTSDAFFPRPSRSAREEAEGKTSIADYGRGFVRSALALLRLKAQRHPGMPVLLEAMNEPWLYTTPSFNGAEYANVIAQLLPLAGRAGIPLSSIYVAAVGVDQRPSSRGPATYPPGWVPAMYAQQPRLRAEVAGWYFHPYALRSSEGIETLPRVRRQMGSGAGNIVVSEVGFCAREVGPCPNGPTVQTSARAAQLLTETLYHALAYRRAGWLRALIVFSRNYEGWAMQKYPGAALTPQGRALDAFALRWGSY
jgi:hypothetical protein